MVLLVTAAVTVAAGAQWRLGTPMAVGAAVLGLLCLRVAGPHVAELPKWLSAGTVGTALLLLGATWEARLEDLRRVAAAARLRVDALR